LATAAVLVVTALSFGGGASAAPLGASLALRDALSPPAQSVQWGGGYYGGDYGGCGGYGGCGAYGGYGGCGGCGGYGGCGGCGGYGGCGGCGGYVEYNCCCPPCYSSGYDGGYGYEPYNRPYRPYRPYRYAPRVYRGHRLY
jgi:hypothetical protein